MRTFFLWMHVSSAAALVGGMTFVFLALRPALSRQAEEAAVKGVSSFVRTRFRLICISLTTLIVASGIVNIILSPPAGWYIVLLIFKVLLGAGVLSLYFRNAFAKALPSAPAEGSAPEPESTGEPAAAKGVSEWKAKWLLAPTSSQVKTELILIGGALVVILLGLILILRPGESRKDEPRQKSERVENGAAAFAKHLRGVRGVALNTGHLGCDPSG